MLRNSTALVLSLGLLPMGAHAEVDLNALLRDFNAARQIQEAQGGAQTRPAPDLPVPFWPVGPYATPRDDTRDDAPAPPTVLPTVKAGPDTLPGPPVAQPVPDGYARLARQAAALLDAWAADRAQPKE